jgi:HEAT repeat protein
MTVSETSETLQALVDQMPDPDGRGMLTENIDKATIETAIAAMAEGGAEAVTGLVDMLGPPGSQQDVKPHYALHCLVNHSLIVGDPEARRQVCLALAGALGGDRPAHVKRFLCQELQWAGHEEAAPALGQLLSDPQLVDAAAMALVAIGGPSAGQQFRAAWAQAPAECRLHIVQGMGAVEDEPSIDALKQALGDTDVEVRLAAGWGLARMGDASSVDRLLEAANVPPGWERIQATKHCMVLAERLEELGQNDGARKIYGHLRDTRTDPAEHYVRDAAQKGLKSL